MEFRCLTGAQMGDFPNKNTQFEKGQSGNPNGRPPGSLNIKTLIQKVWDEEITADKGDPVIRGLLVVKAMFEKAEKGDVNAFKALCERLEGMPNQTLDHSLRPYTVMPTIKKNGKPVVFNVGEPVPDDHLNPLG